MDEGRGLGERSRSQKARSGRDAGGFGSTISGPDSTLSGASASTYPPVSDPSPSANQDADEEDGGGYNLSARASSMNLHSYNQSQAAAGAAEPSTAAGEEDDEDDDADEADEQPAFESPAAKKSKKGGARKKGSKRSSKSKGRKSKPPMTPSTATTHPDTESMEEPQLIAGVSIEGGVGEVEKRVKSSSRKGKKEAAAAEAGGAAASTVAGGSGAAAAAASNMKSSEEICEYQGLQNVDIEFTDEDFQTLTTYKAFCQHVRPMLMEVNQTAAMAKILSLLGAKWREFMERHPYPELLRTTTKLLLNPPPEDDPPTPSTSATKKSKRTTASPKAKPTATTSLKVKLKRKKGGGGSEDDYRATKDRNSDEEFERMLEEADDVYKQEVESRSFSGRKRTAPRSSAVAAALPIKKKVKKLVKKPVKKEVVEMENQDYCEVCGAGGEIILCDTCPKAFHLVCLEPELEEAPEGRWSCPQCEQEGRGGPDKDEEEENEEEEEEEVEVPVEGAKPERSIENMEYCRVCFDGGELLLCDGCPSAFHIECLNPPIKDIPDGEWLCPRCTCPQLKARVGKILHWRWTDPSGIADLPIDPEKGPKRRPPKVREFLVKYDILSYWHCDWQPEIRLDVNQPALVRNYFRKNNMDEPPQLEEISEAKRLRHHDEAELEERFYRYGIRPEWIQVHRIINHREQRTGENQYLVKWRELNYEHCTWEDEALKSVVPDFQKGMDAYWDLRQQAEATTAERGKKKKSKDGKSKLSQHFPDKPTCDPRKQFMEQPDYITATGGALHPYQLEGLNWLRYSWANGTDTILADEMGLGKTIQTIVFLYSLYKEGHCRGPFIVSAPLSTLINWEREFEMWAPDFYVVTYIGDRDARAVIRENEFSFERGAIRSGAKASRVRDGFEVKFNVLLTSMEMVSVDQPTLGSLDWKILVVDEAHRLKNNQSKFFRVLRQYKLGYKLLLTGTPLQNNLEELFHLLNFLSPDRFSDMTEFTSDFADLSKEDQVQKLHDIMGSHLLRRLKADVLKNMPTKSEFIVRVDMNAVQKKYYKFILTRNYEALHTKGGGSSLINVMMELKKCCNHPYLVAAAAAEAIKMPNGSYEGPSLIKACGKLELLSKMLRQLKATGNRVLIFSQMTRMLDILEDFLEYEGYKYERIDGQITGSQRQDAIDRFNEPGAQQFVFLLSTRAGGLGINLATADTVIIYDSDWNPHNDIQAFSRAHRIGQTNKVMIYRYVTRASVEERVTQVAKKKMMLTHLVVRSGGVQFSKKELDDILKFGTEELFKDDVVEGATAEGGAPVKDASGDGPGAIHYDDEAVGRLLDRSQEGIQEKEAGLNEYLSSFKVATYNIVNPAEDEEADDENSQPETTEETAPSGDPVYWERLLRHHFEQHQEDLSRQMGKGKRLRTRRVNYSADGTATQTAVDNWEDFQGAGPSGAGAGSDDNSSFSSPSDDNDEEDDEFGLHSDLPKEAKKGRKRDDGPLPPLLSKLAGGGFEVLGFNPRQRKSFGNGVLRYGIPSEDEQSWQWNIRDLRAKSEKHFRAYAAMFMRHLCEPGPDNAEAFSDGVPREGISRHHILSRIGITSLIKKKVKEFEPVNGKHSMPELLAAMQKQSQQAAADAADKREREREILKLKESGASEEAIAEAVAALPHRQREEKAEDGPPPKPRRKFMFNICDSGFTELHTLWFNEERAIKQTPEHEIWNRKHDYWLLAGIAHHGYGQFNAVQNDPRFAIVNEPFKTATAKMNFLELKNKFMQRRFKLLEQALIVEEQIRRAAYLQLTQDPNGPLMQMSRTYNNIHSVSQNHQDIAAASLASNRPAQVVYRQVLQQLDDLLSDLKQDMTKLPLSVAQLPAVSKRLGMSERGILSQLTANKIKTAAVPGAADDGPSTSAAGQSAAAEDQPFPIVNYYKAGPQFATGVSFPQSLKDFQASPDVEMLDDSQVPSTSGYGRQNGGTSRKEAKPLSLSKKGSSLKKPIPAVGSSDSLADADRMDDQPALVIDNGNDGGGAGKSGAPVVVDVPDEDGDFDDRDMAAAQDEEVQDLSRKK